MAVRIHWTRFKGKLPEDAAYVGRPGPFGNPFKVGEPHADDGAPMTREDAVDLFRLWIAQPEQAALRDRARRELAGKDLACACPLDGGPCHGDVLLALVNEAQDAATAEK
jgi:hypothetical protein